MRWWPVALVLALGVALRGLTMAASGPVSLYLNDSRDYLARAHDLRPDGYHPLGYAVFLRITQAQAHPLLLSVLQHLIGLGTGAVIIVAARRLRLPPWAAALAAAPVLLDPYVAVTEQFVIAETVFTALLVAALLCALAGRGVVAGLLIASATLTRTVALPLILVVLVVVLASRPHRRTWLPAVAAAVLPVAAYAGFFAERHGEVGLSEHGGIYLYGRMASFVSCPATVPAGARTLCDRRPVGQRPQPDYYLWAEQAPLKRLGLSTDAAATLATKTGYAMLRDDPTAWASSTLGYLAHYADPVRSARRVDSTLDTFLVSDVNDSAPPAASPRLADGYRVTATVHAGPTRLLRDLQRTVWTPVWLLAVCLAAGLPGLRRIRPLDRALARAWAASSATALVLLAVPSATVGWDIRFLLPALPFLGLAAACGPALARRGART